MDKHIVIIGAGVSGIAAGVRLLDAGFSNVTILEAEQRIGGRIRTVAFGEGTIDLGAQWCHGEKNNVIYEMAEPYGLLAPGQLTADGLRLRQSDGTTIGPEQTQRLLQLSGLLDVSEADAAAAAAKSDNTIRPSFPSLGELVTLRYAAALETSEYSDLKANGLAEQYLQSLHRYANGLQASDSWFDVALREFATYEECEGDQLLTWKGRGSQTVIDLLLRKIPDPLNAVPLENCIQFAKTVRIIDWSFNTDAENPTIRLECTDGTAIETNHVIWTGSLGVLQAQHGSIFTPPLPTNKTRAIETYKMGTAAKIFLHFESAFWPADWIGFATLWRPQELQELRNTSPDDWWLSAVSGVYIVDYQPNMLCAWISGEQARVMSALPEEQVREALVRLLRMFMRDLLVTEPVALVRSQWNLETNFGGAYSYPTVKAAEVQAERSDLAAPLFWRDVPAVQFAGEATVAEHYGTVHGAVESGWREADRLITLYKSAKTYNAVNINMTIQTQNQPNTHTSNKPANTANDASIVYDVLVLGAGLAGLGAAHKLSSNASINFLILEGQSQAGGRVDTRNLIETATTTTTTAASFSNKPKALPTDPIHFVDTGAQWLHGKCNGLHTVAATHDLLADEQSEEGLGAFIRDDGAILDAYLVKKTDFLVGQILTDCEKYARIEDVDSSSVYPASVSSFLLEHFQPYLDGISDADERQRSQQLLDWHVRFQVIDNSCLTLDDVSAKFWGKYSYNGESCQAHYNFRRGFSSAVDALRADIGDGCFRFNCEVCEVQLIDGDENTDGVCLRVRCLDGRVYLAKHVICTFSMGSLKYGLSRGLFKPALPPPCVQAIEDIGFETINKLFLQFAEPWWGDLDGIQLVFKNEHYENNNWTRHISGFDVMRPGPPNTLLAWVGGHGAVDMEHLSDARIVHDCVTLLNQFTGRQVPTPIRHYFTRWHTNPFVRGAYSYISTRCDRNGTCSSGQLAKAVTLGDLLLSDDNQIKTMATAADKKSVNTSSYQRPLVFFAGEAIHDRYFSTAHGAFLSGIEQAAKILAFYQQK